MSHNKPFKKYSHLQKKKKKDLTQSVFNPYLKLLMNNIIEL